MRSYRSNVLVHLDPATSSDRLHEIQSSLKKQDGVIDAQPSRRLRHYVFVHYDPEAVNSEGILANIRRYGVEARLIGM